jgi:hypothetical protein
MNSSEDRLGPHYREETRQIVKAAEERERRQKAQLEENVQARDPEDRWRAEQYAPAGPVGVSLVSILAFGVGIVGAGLFLVPIVILILRAIGPEPATVGGTSSTRLLAMAASGGFWAGAGISMLRRQWGLAGIAAAAAFFFAVLLTWL